MPVLAIIDDNERHARNIKNSIALAKPASGWIVEVHAPLPDPDEYPAWLMENDIAALILDWHLDEGVFQGRAVQYRAEAVIEKIRGVPALRNFPIYIVTSYPEQSFAEEAKVEAFIDRDAFAEDAAIHYQRIQRAAEHFLAAYEPLLKKLQDLAVLASRGTATTEQLTELKSIQAMLDLDVLKEPPYHYTYVVNELERVVEKLTQLLSEAADDVDET